MLVRTALTSILVAWAMGAMPTQAQAQTQAQVQAPTLTVAVAQSGVYTVQVDGEAWYESVPAPVLCVAGKQTTLQFTSTRTSSGTDKFGAWTGTTSSFLPASLKLTSTSSSSLDLTFKHYKADPQIVVATASFPQGLDTSSCGSNSQLSTNFPAFNTSAAKAPTLNTLSWRGVVIRTTAAAKGLSNLSSTGLDCGPVVSTDATSSSSPSLVWSTLDNHKIVPQLTASGVYAMGIAAAIPSLPVDYSYSMLFSLATGGATSGMYAWGQRIQGYYDISYSKRLSSVTLSDIGYYTDDGAYYYVWGGAKELNDPQLSPWIPPRPWAAEEGLLLVKEALYAQGVPVAYMQLDDWWYNGQFLFGNVKAVVDWHASNSSGLFPHGLQAFSDKLDLPLQLYTPFWSDQFSTKYRTFESTFFSSTKLVVPDDSYHFFADLFDLGKNMTNGRFNTYEIDFMDDNFQGCSACFADVTAAERWYKGMADAAQERSITIQYCLPSATDMLASLAYPAVIQARASGDYARHEGDMKPFDNVVTLGGASLLLGATAMAPSKDTLWTASPQPPTSSDLQRTGYHTQPHVQLDSILATLSLGPVGISDGLNQTDVGLIGQAFRNAHDSTLLRPSRPLSSVDAVWANMSNAHNGIDVGDAIKAGTALDIRSTHASLGKGHGPNSHYVLSWMSTEEVTLQPTDLYPAPAAGTRLAVRKHVVTPAGAAQLAGCVDGKSATPSCVDILPAGNMPVLPAVATKPSDITAYGYWAIYEPTSNGAYFLGELEKFVHVSPQRFGHVLVKGGGPCGLTVAVMGSSGEKIQLVTVDPKGIVHVTTCVIPSTGSVELAI